MIRQAAGDFLMLLVTIDPIGALRPLDPKRVLQLNQELIRIQPPAIENRPHIVVVHDEQISNRPECPPQTGVRPDRLAIRVVLDVAGNRQIR